MSYRSISQGDEGDVGSEATHHDLRTITVMDEDDDLRKPRPLYFAGRGGGDYQHIRDKRLNNGDEDASTGKLTNKHDYSTFSNFNNSP